MLARGADLGAAFRLDFARLELIQLLIHLLRYLTGDLDPVSICTEWWYMPYVYDENGQMQDKIGNTFMNAQTVDFNYVIKWCLFTFSTFRQWKEEVSRCFYNHTFQHWFIAVGNDTSDIFQYYDQESRIHIVSVELVMWLFCKEHQHEKNMTKTVDSYLWQLKYLINTTNSEV